MKKLITALMLVAVFALCAVGLTACGDDKTAYKLWLANGHTGSEADFTAWLNSPEFAINEDGYLIVHGTNTGIKMIAYSQGLAYETSGDNYIVAGIGDCTDTDLIIPETHNGKPVVGIKERAFYRCEAITSAVLSSNAINIGIGAFEYCTSLQKVTLPNGLTSIPQEAFAYCYNLSGITIPKTVTYVDYMAFCTCKALKNVIIPAGVTGIGGMAFAGCESLSRITIPASVTEIGDMSFAGCTALADVYYNGTETDWTEITVGYMNDNLINATRHYAN